MDIKKIIEVMTLEEKAGMCSGLDFWHLKGVKRLGVPSIRVSDGPHGLRKQDDKADHLGINDSITAVCFPVASATACSFDRDLMKEMGEVLGAECQAENVAILLGPAVNMKRSPLCGRNFEYMSEDPYLAGQLAASFIKGVQSKNVGTSIKHFAVNNQEYRRMTCSSEVDQRTLREIYLPAFEEAVKEANPWTVMCSYNRVNGIFASEHQELLTDILRDEWGFSGFVVSDWAAVNDRVAGLKAGLELEMPGNNGINDKDIIEAVKNNTLGISVLDTAVERILNIISKFTKNRREEKFDRQEDHNKARKIAAESIVLLKNDGILPLEKEQKGIAFIGEFATTPKYQGGGSSHVSPFKVTGALEAAQGFASVAYAKGYSSKEDIEEEELFKEAIETAKAASTAFIFAGLPDSFESEGYDRVHMRLPDCQNRLIEEICKVQENTIVILHNGSPVEMPWADKVKAIVEVYLGGEAIGEATADILFGDVNPSGKLAESFPYRLQDNPSYLNFPGNGKKVEYKEGIFIGYRYYDTKEMEVLFPFGHGLSYTQYEYGNLRLSKNSMKDSETLIVSMDVTNTGELKGKEIVQLYVSDRTKAAERPTKELKNFVKVELKPNETKTVTMELSKRAFAWYNEEISDWFCSTGEYEILIGRSSRDIVFKEIVHITSTTALEFKVTENTTIGELMENERTRSIVQEKILSNFNTDEQQSEAVSEEMLVNMMKNNPLRGIRNFGGFDNKALSGLIELFNDISEEKSPASISGSYML